MSRPTWEECLAAGMTQKEAAEARGVHKSLASRWAKRHGATFVRGKTGHAPKGTRHPHLRHLSDRQLDTYFFLNRKKKIPAPEALAMVEAE